MTAALDATTANRLEKAATDNGFDLAGPVVGPWLSFTGSPVRIWLTVLAEAGEAGAVSQHNVFAVLADDATAFDSPAPAEAVGVRGMATFAALDRLVRTKPDDRR